MQVRRADAWRGAIAALLMGMALAAASAQPRIVQPAEEEMVHDNAGTVPVIVTGVDASHRVQPILDDKPAMPPVAPPAFELEGVPRGEHHLVVQVLDEKGNVIARTEPRRFFVWQASRLLHRGSATGRE